MDVYAKIVEKIIAQQETIIGPVALQQAKQVSGLAIDWDSHNITIEGDKPSVIDNLVKQYKALFGQVSVEVCKDVTSELISQLKGDQVPELLK